MILCFALSQYKYQFAINNFLEYKFWIICKPQIQSTVIILKLKGPSETLRHIILRHIVLRHTRFSELKKIQIAQPNFTNEYVIRLLLLEIYIEKMVGNGRNCS